jgi:hypothetical protein
VNRHGQPAPPASSCVSNPRLVLCSSQDLVACLVEQQPKKPYEFLVKTLEKHLPKLRTGVCLRTLLKDVDVDDDRSAHPLDEPQVYTKWLNSHDVPAVFQQALR